MEIGFDMEKLRRPNSGLGQFCKHLGRAIYAENTGFKITHYLDRENNSEIKADSTIQWNRKDALLGVNTSAQVWHCMHQEAKYLPKSKSCKIVLTIHDLNFLDKYKGFKKKSKLNKLQRLVNQADAIAFISNYTQQVAKEHLTIPNIPQAVIYNGVAVSDTPGQKPSFCDDSRFIFSIGIIGAKKNFHVLIEALKHLPDYQLYLCGNKDSEYAKNIQELIVKHQLSDRVILPGEISEGEKNWLYANCSAFVFPSLSEGFGLPVVEAMHYGKPIVISNKTSLPEIAGGQGNILENFTPNHIADQIKKAIDSHSPEKEKALKTRASEFSWNKAAKEYIQIYQTLLGQK